MTTFNHLTHTGHPTNTHTHHFACQNRNPDKPASAGRRHTKQARCDPRTLNRTSLPCATNANKPSLLALKRTLIISHILDAQQTHTHTHHFPGAHWKRKQDKPASARCRHTKQASCDLRMLSRTSLLRATNANKTSLLALKRTC